MTNFEIILRDAIAAEIYTEEEVEKLLETKGELPLHTFKIWKDKGYSVKKGEHAKLTTMIWKQTKKKDKETGEEKTIMVMTKAFFFTDKQVQKIG